MMKFNFNLILKILLKILLKLLNHLNILQKLDLPIKVEKAQNKNRPSSTEIGIKFIGCGIMNKDKPINI